MEQFVVRVFQGGKVTIPKRIRELLNIEDMFELLHTVEGLCMHASNRLKETSQGMLIP